MLDGMVNDAVEARSLSLNPRYHLKVLFRYEYLSITLIKLIYLTMNPAAILISTLRPGVLRMMARLWTGRGHWLRRLLSMG